MSQDTQKEREHDNYKERDVIAESNKIKRSILQDTEVKQKKYKFEFTKPIEYHIPGLNLTNVKSTDTEFYCPDFYHLNVLIARMTHYVKSDATVKRIAGFNEPRDEPIKYALETFEVCGYDRNPLPEIFLPWVTSIGKYVLPDKSRAIEPRLPEIATDGPAFLSYFWSESTSQHLPNFRAILMKIRLLCKSGNMGAIADRNIEHYRNVAHLAAHALMPTSLVRSNDHWIPGSSILTGLHSDMELIRLASIASESIFPNAVSRYLQLHVNLLNHIQAIVAPVVELSPCFSVSGISVDGGPAQFITLHESVDDDQIIPLAIPPAPEIPRVRPVDIVFLQLHAPAEVIDGDIYTCASLPLARVIPRSVALFAREEERTDAVSKWLMKEKKFRSIKFTSEEALTQFRMKRLD